METIFCLGSPVTALFCMANGDPPRRGLRTDQMIHLSAREEEVQVRLEGAQDSLKYKGHWFRNRRNYDINLPQ